MTVHALPGARVVKRFRPSNATEGAIFEAHFCDVCERERAWREGEADPCPILSAALAYALEDPEYPAEWIEDEAGPRCTAFEPEQDCCA